MLIDCPSCARSYHVSRAALGEQGRTVVCPLCEARWYVEATKPPPAQHCEPDDLWAGRVSSAGRHAVILDEPEALHDRGHVSDAPPFPSSDRVPLLKLSRGVKRGTARSSSESGSLWPIGVGLACILLSMGLIAKRNSVVAAVPRTAALYSAVGLPVNIRELEFADVKALGLDDAGHIEISGTIRNIAHGKTTMPRITFAIRDATGATVSTWSEKAPKRALASDESIAFVTQSSALPKGAKDVVVRFDSDERGAPLVGPATR